MTVYVVALVTVTDPSWIAEYGPAVDAQVQAAGGKYIVRELEIEQLEGSSAVPTVMVVLEFPDKAAARSWYDSSEYAPFMKARQAGSNGDLFMVNGL